MVDGLAADAEYFQTLGIPIRRGRAFTDADRENTARVAIVDESLARSVWPGQDPIGKQIGIVGAFHTVVGVAGDTRYRDLLQPRKSVYIPYRQSGRWGPSFIALRTTRDISSIGASLRAAVHDAEPRFIISQITTLNGRIDAATSQPKLNALLLGGFAISILLLTALGLYSIAATYVRHREFEIAVRVALGATPREVVRLVLGQGISVVIAGAAVGAVGRARGSRRAGVDRVRRSRARSGDVRARAHRRHDRRARCVLPAGATRVACKPGAGPSKRVIGVAYHIPVDALRMMFTPGPCANPLYRLR